MIDLNDLVNTEIYERLKEEVKEIAEKLRTEQQKDILLELSIRYYFGMYLLSMLDIGSISNEVGMMLIGKKTILGTLLPYQLFGEEAEEAPKADAHQ